MATVAMFKCDLYAGVVPQMSPPPHDLKRLRTTMVDFIVIFNRDAASCRGLCTGRVFHPAHGPLNGHPPSNILNSLRRHQQNTNFIF